MSMAVLGTGNVGKTLADELSKSEPDLILGTRNVESTMSAGRTDNDGEESFATWLGRHPGITLMSFRDAIDHASLIFLAIPGSAALGLLADIGAEAFTDKILVDLTNPLDFSNGMPPTLSIVNNDSLGERIQAALPLTRVVKTLNTVSASLMVNPGQLAGNHSMFMAGNDPGAKTQVRRILQDKFGWKDILDLGDISRARGMEMYLPLWLRIWESLGSTVFNIKLMREGNTGNRST